MSTTEQPQEEVAQYCKVHVHPKDKTLIVDEQVHVYDEIPDEAGQAIATEIKTWLSTHEEYNKEENAYLHARMTDAQIYRFCRARQFKTPKVQEMIEEYFAWCARVRPDQIRFRDIALQAETGKVSVRGKDRFGRTVMVLHNEYENSQDHAANIKHMIWNLDKAVRDMNNAQPGPSRYVVVLQMSGFSYFNQPPMHVAKEIANALGNAYPERLGNVFIFNAPWLFRAFYTALTVVLDERTKKKIHFVKENEYEDKLSFFLGENWPQLTGIGQKQVNDKTAHGFDPEAWKAAGLADDLERFGEEDAKDENNAEVNPTSPSVVIVDAADCQSPQPAEEKK